MTPPRREFHPLQAEEIARAFHEEGVDYLFLGKSGAILLGYPGTTQDVDVFPRTVTAQGPESSLRKVTEALTASVNVDGATGSFDKLARVEPPAEYGVKLDESSVRITVTMSKAKKQAREH